MASAKELKLDVEEHVVDKNKNPALDKRRPGDDSPWAFLRKGWFWGTLLAVVAVSVVTPLALRAQHQIRGDVNAPPSTLKAQQQQAWGPPGALGHAAWGGGGGGDAAPPSCEDLGPELPTDKLSGGRSAPPLRADGGRLVAAGKGAGGAPAALAGVNWPGFESGATFVAGLGVQKQPTWAGSDFAAAAASLRLLGFNAVRLPFTFDGLQAAPQDVARPCEGPAPNATALAARGADPDAPGRGRGAAAPELYFPPGYGAAGGGGGGGCNGYVPRGPTTLARLLWVAEYLVRAGFYVVLEYRPPAPPGGGGGGQADGGGAPAAAAGVPPELSSPDAFAAAWQRLGAALACVPAWKEAMAGRVALDLLSSPQALHLGWKSAGSGGGGGGDSGMAPLGDYYLSALDALDAAGGAPGLLYLLQGGGDGAPGAAAALGGAFVAGKGDAERLGVASAAGFFGALAGRPYRGRVALAPVIAAGDAGGAELALGPRQWQGYAASWGALQARGFCEAAKPGAKPKRDRYPAAAVSFGGRIDDPRQAAYLADAAAFLTATPPADKFAPAPASGWFWATYTGDAAAPGIIGADGATLRWPLIRWLQEHLGLAPWYARAGAAVQQQAAKAGKTAAKP